MAVKVENCPSHFHVATLAQTELRISDVETELEVFRKPLYISVLCSDTSSDKLFSTFFH